MTTSEHHRPVGRSRSESIQIETTIPEHGGQLTTRFLAAEAQIMTERLLPDSPAACMSEKGPSKKWMVLRVRQRGILSVRLVSFEDVEDSAGFAGHEGGRIGQVS